MLYIIIKPMVLKLKNIKYIAIVSDSHDDLTSLSKITEILKDYPFDAIIHAGDICSSKIIDLLATFKKQLICVYGNCDKDKEDLSKSVSGKGIINESPFEFYINNKRFLLTHDIDLIKDDLQYNPPDVVIHGHTHSPEIIEGKTLIINPGEASGWYTNMKTFCILDVGNMTAEIIEVY